MRAALQATRAYSTASENVIKHVTVIGAGLMGSGIAQVSAQAGLKTTIVDVSPEVLKKSEGNITTSLARVAKKIHNDDNEKQQKFVAETMQRLHLTSDLNKAVDGTDLVVESVVENLELKVELFKNLEKMTPETTILTSNTSSFLISDITTGVKKLDRVGGTHFFNPVPIMKLLEIVRLPETSDATYNALLNWGRQIGKTTVTSRDTPGFIVNRLLVPYKAEALRMVERGDATARDVDIAMKLGAGYPMGPIELLDYVGVDTFHYIMQGWHKKYPDIELFNVVESAKKKLEEGKLGRKSGEGFYSYK